ncbi:MAG: hypothetical protein ACM3QS_08180 [Bacteroidota bacterium]
MTRDPGKDPRSRMRDILTDGETRPTPVPPQSPLSRLPRARPLGSGRVASPPPPAPPAAPEPSPYPRFGPAFWTITGLLSLIVNGILIAIVIYLVSSVTSLQMTASDAGSNVLAGLYTNFEKMDRASIISSIPVETQVPLNITVPIRQTTAITLASDAVISNARVQIQTSALNINAPAQVVLPAGTTLQVAMDFTVPVQDSVPVRLDVPVNIPLSQTQLHEPFTGLQNVVKPYYCLIEPNALNLDGQPVCR